jgi:hypothetical protein
VVSAVGNTNYGKKMKGGSGPKVAAARDFAGSSLLAVRKHFACFLFNVLSYLISNIISGCVFFLMLLIFK